MFGLAIVFLWTHPGWSKYNRLILQSKTLDQHREYSKSSSTTPVENQQTHFQITIYAPISQILWWTTVFQAKRPIGPSMTWNLQ